MQNQTRSETVARWSTYILFALGPLFFIPVPWVSVIQSKLLLIAIVVTVGFLALVLHSLNATTFRIPKSSLLIAAALVPMAYLTSALATGASWEAFVGDGRGQDTVIGFLLLYVALLVAAGTLWGSRFTLLFRLFLTGGVIIILLQIVHLIIPSLSFGGVLPIPAASVVGSWHSLGIFLALLIFVSLALMRTSTFEGFWNYIAAIVVLAALSLLVVINFGDVWLGLLGVSLFGALFFFRATPGTMPSRVRAIAPWLVCAVIATGMYFEGSAVQTILPESLQVVQVEVRPSWQGTFAIGEKVFTEPMQIFFGSGPNTFPREWGFHKPLSVNATQFWNTDFYYGVGFIPTSLVTTGVAGFIAWGAIGAALLWGLYRLFREPSGGAMRVTLLGSALFLTAFHVLYVPGPALSLMTFLVFGALVAHLLSTETVHEWSVPVSWDTWRGRVYATLLSLFGLVVLFGSVQSIRALVSDILVNRAVVEYSTTQDIAKASNSIALALVVLPGSDRAHRAGVELGLLQLSQLVANTDGSEAAQAELQNTLNATIQHGLSAIEIESSNYQNWLILAQLYGELAGVGVEGSEQAARDAYASVIVNNPTSPIPYLGIARLDLAKGDNVAAQTNLESALSIKPDFTPAHFLISQIYAQAGDFTRAQEHATAVVQVAQQDPLGWYNLGTILYSTGNFSDAAASFEQAAALQNDYANALFLLGLSYYQLERVDDALRILGFVQTLNPGDAALADLMATIRTGGDLESVSQ